MSKQLFKQPNKFVFWLVLASGVAVVLVGQSDSGGAGLVSTITRTVFWCSAVAYFSIRVYQFATRGKEDAQAEPAPDDDLQDNG